MTAPLDLIDDAEAAAILGVRSRRLHDLRKALTPHTVDGRTLYCRSDVERLIAERAATRVRELASRAHRPRTPIPEGSLTRAALAARLGTTVADVRRLDREGELLGFGAGTARRYTEYAISMYEARRREQHA